MIGILKLGVGNHSAVYNSLTRLGFDAIPVKSPSDLNCIDSLIMPGVGSFDFCIQSLIDSSLYESIQNYALTQKRPILGICAGMQIMFDNSEEGQLEGLSLLNGSICQLSTNNSPHLTVPHIGVCQITGFSQFAQAFSIEGYDTLNMYFIHSYALLSSSNSNLITARTVYGSTSFISAFRSGNIWGIQAHPEKSHTHGRIFLQAFLDSVCV